MIAQGPKKLSAEEMSRKLLESAPTIQTLLAKVMPQILREETAKRIRKEMESGEARCSE